MKGGLECESITKKELLSLLGHLNFAMRIIPQGRSLISMLIDMSKTIDRLLDPIKLECSFGSSYLKAGTGFLFFYNDIETSVAIIFFTDGTPLIGFGGFFNNQWFASTWPKDLLDLPSNTLSTGLRELYPVVVACILWGNLWSRKQILV